MPKGFRMKVFPQLASPTIIIFLYFPRPLWISSFTTSENDCTLIPFCHKTCLAQVSHIPLHSGTHSVLWASLKMSIRLFLERDRRSCAVFNSHAVFETSATTLGPQFTTNTAISVLPSIFCSFARASSSVLVFIPFSTIISNNWNDVRCFFFCLFLVSGPLLILQSAIRLHFLHRLAHLGHLQGLFFVLLSTQDKHDLFLEAFHSTNPGDYCCEAGARPSWLHISKHCSSWNVHQKNELICRNVLSRMF